MTSAAIRKKITSEDLRKVLDAERTGRIVKDPKFAVVAPVVFEADEPYLLVEVRAAGIPQAGDPCFPGGMIEPGETPEEAASREMQEELGITVPPGKFLGQLPEVYSYLGRQTRIFVCPVSPEMAEKVCINPDEVERLLKVPMALFMAAPSNMEFPFDGSVIWGMTAAAIRRLCKSWERAEKE